MFSVSFEVNGRKVSPNNLKNALETAMLQGIQESVRKAVGSLRCREHGQAPRVVFKGRSLDKLDAHIDGCCEQLIEQVRRKLS